MDMIEMKESDLNTAKYTAIEHENLYAYNAPHHFEVVACEDTRRVVCKIDMQEGPILENGVNGCCNEDLLNIVLKRLESFQSSKYSCRENAIAITKLEEALLWLHHRTNKRAERGVEGTHLV